MGRVGRDADRDGHVDRVARRLDDDIAGGHGAADPLGDLRRLLDAGLGQENRELLAAEAGGHVVVAQLVAEHLRDLLEHRVTGEVPVVCC